MPKTCITVFTTYSGRKINYLKPGKISLEDVALGISRMPRYAGQTLQPYSVAQHSLLVAELCPEYRLYSLIHDAQEAFLCDLPTPAKEALRALGSEAYDELEWRLYAAVCRAVGLEERHVPLPVKIADVACRKIEEAALKPKGRSRVSPVLRNILALTDGGGAVWLQEVRREVARLEAKERALPLS